MVSQFVKDGNDQDQLSKFGDSVTLDGCVGDWREAHHPSMLCHSNFQ
jgi:hypothetical protein